MVSHICNLEYPDPPGTADSVNAALAQRPREDFASVLVEQALAAVTAAGAEL